MQHNVTTSLTLNITNVQTYHQHYLKPQNIIRKRMAIVITYAKTFHVSPFLILIKLSTKKQIKKNDVLCALAYRCYFRHISLGNIL